MTPLLPVETGPASDTVLALETILAPGHGAAADDHRDEVPPRSARRRILETFTAALAATRRGAGD
jgi:hypothetical protein